MGKSEILEQIAEFADIAGQRRAARHTLAQPGDILLVSPDGLPKRSRKPISNAVPLSGSPTPRKSATLAMTMSARRIAARLER